MDFKIFKEEFPEKILKYNVPMKEFTSFKVGGPADLMVLPKSSEDIKKVLKITKENNMPCLVMGNGSNMLVNDRGIRGVVLKIGDGLNSLEHTDYDEITAGAGISLSSLANFALSKELGGMEFASGIPGSLGGALYMNAGAYGGEMKDIAYKVYSITIEGEEVWLKTEEMEFGYRESVAQKANHILVMAILKLKKQDKDKIKEMMVYFNRQRKDKQPLEYPSAGSTFKRPKGHFAGKLIMDSGLRGFSIGGAQVSEKHCGFIINKGGATAYDILKLIDYVKETVYNNFNIMLEPELKIVL